MKSSSISTNLQNTIFFGKICLHRVSNAFKMKTYLPIWHPWLQRKKGYKAHLPGSGANEFIFVYIFLAPIFFVPRRRRRRHRHRRSGREICITCGFRFLGHERYLYRIECLGLIDSLASLLNS